MSSTDDSPSSSGRSSPTRSRSPSPGRTYGHRSLPPQLLIELSLEFYRSFNPAQLTLDSHANNCIQQAQITNIDDEVFIKQVLYGIVRYRKFLGSLMDSFYFYNSGTALRNDADMYKVYAYLAIFRLEELTFPSFKRLVDVQDPQKMVVFLSYLFNQSNLSEIIRNDWLKLYDKQFIDDTIQTLLSWMPEFEQLLSALEQKVYLNKRQEEEKEAAGVTYQKKTTTIEPFNLSQPKPKPAYIEEPIPPPIKAKPAPKFKEGLTKDQQEIESTKMWNKKELEAKYSDPRFQPFKLRVLERPTNIDKIKKEIEEDVMRELTFKPVKPKPIPNLPPAPVRLNAAAILREDNLYKRKQQEEAEILKRYESELRDASEFKEWQQKMLSLDEATRAAEVERRRLEMAASQEAAIRARQQKVEENQELGRATKAEAKKLEEQLSKEREVTVKVNQQRREAVAADRVKVEQAQEKLAMERKLAAEEERRRQVEDARQLAEQAARDLAEKKDIIMQLRALERVPKQRVAVLDPTAMPDYGLMEQMSLIELRERLTLAKTRQKEEEERQRAQILGSKQEREAMLSAKAANIQRMRKLAAAKAQTQRSKSAQAAVNDMATAAARHETGVLALRTKLDAKRETQSAERSRIAAEQKKVLFEQMQQAAGAAAVEEGKFRELRSGARRQLISQQSNTLQSATLAEGTKAKAQAVRSRNVKQDQKNKTDFIKMYDDKLKELTQQAEAGRQQDYSMRSQMVATQRDFELQQKEKHHGTAFVPFAATNQSSMKMRLTQLANGVEL